MLLPSQDAKFGDYQANFAMPLGKRLGKPPREIAQQLVALVDVADLCEPPEVAGPGFINLRLKDDDRRPACRASQDAERLGVPRSPSRGRSSSTIRRPTSPSRCTSATSARP